MELTDGISAINHEIVDKKNRMLREQTLRQFNPSLSPRKGVDSALSNYQTHQTVSTSGSGIQYPYCSNTAQKD